MSENELITADKIIQAAVALIEEKGFHSVTMKEIASAVGISEMTVFRHFSSKKGVLEAVIQECSFVPPLREIFENKLTWELETDLILISETYQQIMERNQSVVLILIQERTTLSSENWENLPPYHFKDFMVNYFKEMQTKRKIVTQDIDALTLAFMSMNFGYFFSKAMFTKKFVDVSNKAYLEVCVQLFVKGLKP
jgi:TetR/AcrR family transcriptional repressor of mexJK operon